MFFTDGQKESGGTGVIRSDAAAAFYAGRALNFFSLLPRQSTFYVLGTEIFRKPVL